MVVPDRGPSGLPDGILFVATADHRFFGVFATQISKCGLPVSRLIRDYFHGFNKAVTKGS